MEAPTPRGFHLYSILQSLFGRPVNLGYYTRELCYLDIVDLSISAAPTDDGAALKQNDPIFLRKVRDKPDISSSLENLPNQEANILRVYVDEFDDDDNRWLQGHINRQYQLPGYDEPNSRYTTGFKAIAALWRQRNPNEWFLSKSYHFAQLSSFLSPENPWRSAGSSDSSIDSGSTSDLRAVLAHPDEQWAQIMRRLSMQEAEDGRLVVFISCKTFLRRGLPNVDEQRPYWLAEILVSELLELDSLYRAMRNNHNWRKVFLLQYLHANMNLFSDFLNVFIRDYVEPRRPDFDPRISRLRPWVLEEMTRDAYHYQQLINVAHELADIVESLIDVMKLSTSATDTETSSTFLALEQELSGCCRDTRGRVSRLANDMANNLKLLDLDRNMSQTANVQLLTILATISIPLSIAAGVLSMQSRFADLGVLLYDFFGVASLLGAIALIILTVIRTYEGAKDSITRWHKNVINRPITQLVWGILEIILVILGWVLGGLILASFVVGMFKDVVLGAKILGYGLAATMGGPAIILVLYISLSCFFGMVAIGSCIVKQ